MLLIETFLDDGKVRAVPELLRVGTLGTSAIPRVGVDPVGFVRPARARPGGGVKFIVSRELAADAGVCGSQQTV